MKSSRSLEPMARPRARRIETPAQAAPSFNPHLRLALVAVLATLVVTLAILLLFRHWDILFIWLIAINLIALLAFGYNARSSATGFLIPETVLILLVLLGGCLGGLAGRLLLRYHIRARWFEPAFWASALASLVLAGVYYTWLCPGCR